MCNGASHSLNSIQPHIDEVFVKLLLLLRSTLLNIDVNTFMESELICHLGLPAISFVKISEIEFFLFLTTANAEPFCDDIRSLYMRVFEIESIQDSTCGFVMHLRLWSCCWHSSCNSKNVDSEGHNNFYSNLLVLYRCDYLRAAVELV